MNVFFSQILPEPFNTRNSKPRNEEKINEKISFSLFFS
jgi:hypothetical protein